MGNKAHKEGEGSKGKESYEEESNHLESQKNDEENALNMLIESCINEIIEGKLYLGNQFAAGHKSFVGVRLPPQRALQLLKETHGITHIVCVTQIQENGTLMKAELFPDDFKYLYLPFSDESKTDLIASGILERTNHFIHSALKEGNNRVFVHCQMGQSRSAAIVMGYIMWSQRLSFEEAFKLVKSKRPLVSSERFGDQLKSYESYLRDQQLKQEQEGKEEKNSLTITVPLNQIADSS